MENEMIVAELVPENPFQDPMLASLEISFDGEQGSLDTPVRFDMGDEALLHMARECLQNGDVRGIAENQGATLENYKVHRYPAQDGLPNRIAIRPKTAFGGDSDPEEGVPTLLIWEEVPERTLIHLIPNAPSWVAKCHNLYLNHNEMSEEIEGYLVRISDAVCESPEYYTNAEDPLAGAWVEYKIGTQSPEVLENLKTLQVVLCGFMS